jgi:tetratricopeptide (TPR) repeat protein
MSKQKIKKETPLLPLEKNTSLGFSDFKIQALILIIIGFIFYANSFQNEYALDDGIVIEKNEYVQQGFRGIPKILKADAYESFYKQMGAGQQLSGGRYRPLSIVTFAIEQQLFGSNEKIKPTADVAFIRHFTNVIIYILSIIVLLYFLKTYIFKENTLPAFITCLIFLIHPIHTEVIANVKSRDEILSFLFIILTFIAAFRYQEKKQIKQLFYALLFYFSALLSKEYAITLLLLIPMLFYIVNGYTLKKTIIATAPFIVVAVIYLLIRLSIVGTGVIIKDPDVLNSPFKFATNPQKWATKIEILNHYLKLLFYPHPLSSDYSYSTIPYTNFKDGLVWTSIVIHLSMIVATIVLFFKRNILGFALAFYLLHLALVSNFLMDIGATMGERLIYHSSLGFAIIVAIFINWLLQKITDPASKKVVGITLGCIVTIWSATITIARNTEWKNDTSLFTADAEIVPNSALVNGNAGKAYIELSEKAENKSQELELIKKAIYHLNRAVTVHTKYVNGYINLGVAYFKLKDYDKAKDVWNIAKAIYPNNPYIKQNFALLASAYYTQGMSYGAKDPKQAIIYLEKTVAIDSTNADYWYNLGGANFSVQEYEKARKAWIKTLQLKPDYIQAQQGMNALPIKK